MRCEYCPVDRDKVCLGDANPGAFAHFCRWATSDEPREREMVVLRSTIGFVPPVPASPRPAPLTPAVASLASLPLAGDLIRRATERFGIDRLAEYVVAKLGKDDCGCASRAEALNRLDASLRKYFGR